MPWSTASHATGMDAAASGVVLLRPDGTVVYATCSVAQMLGYAVEELDSRNFFDIVQALDLHGEPVTGERLLAATVPERPWRCRCKGGRWSAFETSVARVSADRPEAAILLTLRWVADPASEDVAEWTIGQDRRDLAERLEAALHRREFVLYYQPKVDIRTGEVCGVEALSRWHSPELGLIPPSRFIPLLEESGLILPMGEWALRQAVQDQQCWREQGLRAVPVAVNISPIQLAAGNFVETLAAALREAPLGAVSLDLEITESVLMEGIEEVIPKLHAARALGVSIAIDDFGTGYSSLKYLARLPVNVVKIDRSFTREMIGSARVAAVVAAVISLAHAMELRAIAEGVETVAQLRQLERFGCNEAQGYLMAPPMPAARLARFLEATAPPLLLRSAAG